MILVSAQIGPFRSMNTVQTVKIDPEVTVFVGMNEAGKTVVLKALQKCDDALDEDEFNVIEDYPRKDLTTYTKKHASAPAAVAELTYRLDDSLARSSRQARRPAKVMAPGIDADSMGRRCLAPSKGT
ncbi:MAG: hypothetical protein JF586_18025 [Burkholderiales bacterium]|nr:hypothetical protein [Burkholderiales bacterium]